MIFVAGRGFCQKNQRITLLQKDLYYYKKAGLLSHTRPPAANNSIARPYFTIPARNIPVINADYYSSRLGFFCKKELQFEKIMKLPFKFRLGSVQECDRLEGKPNTQY